MEKTKVGVIGLGGIAQLVHLPNLNKMNNVTISSVAETKRSRLEAISDKFNITERYTDYNDLLTKSDCDAVIIATPTNTHKDIAIDCLKAKKDILVEKPLARSFEDAKPIIETAKKGVTTFDGILQLQKSLEEKLKSLGNRNIDARKVVDYLYTQPIIEVSKVEELLQKSSVTAYKLLADLERLDVIKEISGAQRNKLYVFKDYLDLFNQD